MVSFISFISIIIFVISVAIHIFSKYYMFVQVVSEKKLYNFQILIAEKLHKAQHQQFGGQKHNFPVCKIFKWYHSMVRCKSYGSLTDELLKQSGPLSPLL